MVGTKQKMVVIFTTFLCALAGCASGPAERMMIDASALAVGVDVEESARIVEYEGSDVGEPIPGWMSVPDTELEQLDQFDGRLAFRFQVEEVGLEPLIDTIRDFPGSQRTSAAVYERARTLLSADHQPADELIDEAGRVLLAVEYMGYERYDDFWVREQLVDQDGSVIGERYRGWILVSVPREQVIAALELAYRNAASHHPVQDERDRRAREWLQAQYLHGL